MQYRFFLYVLLLAALCAGCKKSNKNPGNEIKLTYTFSSGAEGWTGDYADYPNDPQSLPLYQLEWGPATLPQPLNTSDAAVRQSGDNRSDDLFMFIKRKVTGLQPGKTYSVNLKLVFATNAASNMMGVGGAPGESVWIKAGAVATEPVKVVRMPENWFRMNIDKGNQSTSGADMKIIGNFANGTSLNEYKLKEVSHTTPFTVVANAQGEIWLIVGTDSGFEGRTTIFYNTVEATIR